MGVMMKKPNVDIPAAGGLPRSGTRVRVTPLPIAALIGLLIIGTLAAANRGIAESASSVVRGRIEVFNSRLQKPRGESDASGVAVWLEPAKGSAKQESFLPSRVRLEQRDKRFIPHVLVIQAGTEVDFPNSDPFFHNVFSVYDGKAFDLGLYANGESRPVRFDRPGISYIFCNIHPQMSAVIVTVATPFFGVTAPDGTFAIKSPAPGGAYDLNIWHERCDTRQLEALRRKITVDSAGADLGVIRLDEAGYIPKAHKNKFGDNYPAAHGTSPYGSHSSHH
jgi:plastocyanin